MKVSLDKISTKANDNLNKDTIKVENKEITTRIADLQRKMEADGSKSLLIIFQGMDASGKDGAVRRLFSGVNPAGINVSSWKKPTEEEFAHDFLWRIHKAVPKKGMIQVFNRSHYEDILVPMVNNYIDQSTLKKRFNHINNFEQMLSDEGTTILKFYLHTSKDEQLERLTERLENPEKYWKHNDGDWETREQWNDYRKVYETIFDKCDTIPWHIIPADQNWHKVYQIGKIVLKTLEKMKFTYPPLQTDRFENGIN